MPQIVLLLLVGAGLWLRWQEVTKEMSRVGRERHDRQPGPAQTVELEKDPKTGVYRPKD